MLAELIPLWNRIEAYALDDDAAALPFSARLARENRWPLPFAARAIQEYKRFVLLALRAGHPVTPSDAVDQVWHLHLTYTQSYWDSFCPEVLGSRLQHGPTRGGPVEQARYGRDYERTLESYERCFGEPAPEDLWPPAARRFERALEGVRVARVDHWVLRKPSAVARAGEAWRSLGGRLRLLLIGVAVLGALALGSTRGLPSVAIAAGLTALCLACARRVRAAAGHAAGPRIATDPVLDPYELGYLAGGRGRLLDLALVELVSSGALALDTTTNVLARSGPAPATASVFARRVHECVATELPARQLLALGGAFTQHVERRLQRHGLLATGSWLAVAVALLGPLLGSLRLGVGLARGEAVGLLGVACGVGTWLAFRLRPSPQALTSRGRSVLRGSEMNAMNAMNVTSDGPAVVREEQSSPARVSHGVMDPRLATQIALSGSAVLIGTDLEALATLRAAPAACTSPDGGAAQGGARGGGGCGGYGCAGDPAGCSGSGCGGGCGGCGGGCGG